MEMMVDLVPRGVRYISTTGLKRQNRHQSAARLFLHMIMCLSVIIVSTAIWLWNSSLAGAEDDVNSRNASEVQMLVDAAKQGETVVIPAGVYEGTLTIDKPIFLVAEGEVLLQNETDKPAVTITADRASIRGLSITQKADREIPALLLTANEVLLQELNIETSGYGIMLRDADRNEITDTRMKWVNAKKGTRVKMSDKRNGIDLYNSHHNVISNNQISRLNDGIYLERSNDTVVSGNIIEYSRYGIHCMYTDRTHINDNEGSYNITGAMVMIAQEAELSGNTFYKQNENVMSQGILLYDVKDSKIHDNRLEGNRIGIYMEQSKMNELSSNEVHKNFVGIQLISSTDNRLYANQFVTNVIDAEAMDSDQNELSGNYWDAFSGIDTDGDGYSNTAYAINPFFSRLTADQPAYQLFFQSPGMQFLESMFAADQDNWTRDEAPLMKPANPIGQADDPASGRSSSDTMLASISLCLLLGSMMIMFISRRKR
ncbi:right-handed parallel beta-helix repeat-containing protein [Paenibacillus marinisediminis]